MGEVRHVFMFAHIPREVWNLITCLINHGNKVAKKLHISEMQTYANLCKWPIYSVIYRQIPHCGVDDWVFNAELLRADNAEYLQVFDVRCRIPRHSVPRARQLIFTNTLRPTMTMSQNSQHLHLHLLRSKKQRHNNKVTKEQDNKAYTSTNSCPL